MKCLPAAPAALLVLVAALWIVPGAGAAITATQVAAPSNPSSSIYEPEAPSMIAVTGTATGAAVGEEVDLRCYEGAESALIDPNVAVASGSFSATIVPNTDSACVLRAVPAGTEPTVLTQFTGPVLATGESREFFTEGDVNEGMPYDFYTNGQQLTAADDYVLDRRLRSRRRLFCGTKNSKNVRPSSRNDFYEWDNGAQPTESAFKVDGENAYFSYNAEQINEEANGFPQLTYGYSQDPANGNLTISDEEQAAICPDPTYPPNAGTCEEFLPSGVRIARKIEQTHDGHLVLITDSLESTDGKSHAVEALPENEQDFNRHGKSIEYKFPGESGYVPRVEGETVSFPDTGTNAVYIKVTGSADGDIETGRGAIVFFQPSSPAIFNSFAERRNSFFFDNEETVPATGTATIKYAYAQAYNQAEVEALVGDAIGAAPAPPAPSPTPGGTSSSAATQTSTGSAAKAKFRIRKVTHFKSIGTLEMRVLVTGPGKLTLTGKRVKSATLRVTKKGNVFLTVAPTPELKELMVERGVVHVTVNVKFVPDHGSSRVKVKKMRLVLNG